MAGEGALRPHLPFELRVWPKLLCRTKVEIRPPFEKFCLTSSLMRSPSLFMESNKVDNFVFRGTPDGSQADPSENSSIDVRRNAIPEAVQPFVSIATLAALWTLLQLAVEDRTPSRPYRTFQIRAHSRRAKGMSQTETGGIDISSRR